MILVFGLEFLSTLSLRRATVKNYDTGIWAGISIHALLAESDDTYVIMEATKVEFLSTLSLRRATNSACCGVRRKYISIHALLAESD